MVDCKDLSLDCPGSAECTLARPLDIQDVKDFFSTFTTCSTTYVYINQNGEGETRDTLKGKQVKVKKLPECNMLFTEKKGYFYVYCGLLHRIVVWAKDPRAFARQGYIGHHRTIGFKNNSWDIHDTIYGTMKNIRGEILISPIKNTIRYKVVNNKLKKLGNAKSVYESDNEDFWNEIVCEAVSLEGSGLVRAKTKVKVERPIKLLRKSIVTAKPVPLKTSDIVQKFKSLYIEACNLIHNKKEGAIIRIPYVSKLRERGFLKGLTKADMNMKTDCILWSYHHDKVSFVTINMFID